MPVHFDNIRLGGKWDRHMLAKEWGYVDYHALARGCVAAKNRYYVVLFYTGNSKRYSNKPNGRILTADSDDRHSTDHYKLDAFNGKKEIHLFYRETNTDSFTYCGIAKITKYQIKVKDPSEFTYEMQDWVFPASK